MIAKRLGLSALLAVALSACSTARISQFDGFAAAGIKYTEAIPAVYDQAFETAVRTDSLVLRDGRPHFSQNDRLKEISVSNEKLATRFEILTALKVHAAELRAYFIALKALASSEAGSGLTQATKDLAANLGKLDDRITKLSVGSLPINDFIGQAVPLVVAQYKSSALNAELKDRAQSIERELNLQEAAISAIAAQMKSDVAVRLTAQDRDEIVIPYVRDGSLPSDWNEKRLQGFRRRLDLGVIDAAVSAAKNLRLSYVALVENRLDDGGLLLLIGDINKLIGLIEGIKGK